MDRLVTTVLGQKVPNVLVTYLQDLAMAQRPANVGDLTAMAGGIEARVWQSAVNVADNTFVVVDTNVVNVINTGVSPNALTAGTLSWRDRLLFGIYPTYTGANRYPGQADDYLLNDGVAPVMWWGYTGVSGKDGGGVTPTNGSPPVPAAGASWAIQVVPDLWLYVNPTTGSLNLYNDTGATIITPLLWFLATGALGKR